MEKVYLIGNAHIDPLWLWHWQEGFSEIRSTFRSALDRLKEFGEFVFTSSSVAYYEWIETVDPAMFEEIRERVRQKRWIICGGWWVQPDCNTPSGESFIRQGLVAQHYLREKFGVMASVAYNVDSFGHNGALPQIFKKSGLNSYVFMRPSPEENGEVPQYFLWVGNDKTAIPVFRIAHAYNDFHPSGSLETKVEEAWEQVREEKQNTMTFFGVGNHGGGPTVRSLQLLRKFEEADEAIIASPVAFFAETPRPEKTYSGSLLHHAIGCYSANSRFKRAHMKAENALVRAEKLAGMANALLGASVCQADLLKAWKKVLFNEFHDALCGCSIESAYESAHNQIGEAASIAEEVTNLSLQRIAAQVDTLKGYRAPSGKYGDWRFWEIGELGSPVILFNPLGVAVEVPMFINRQLKEVRNEQSESLPIQWVRGEQTNGADKYDTLFLAKLPAMGYAIYYTFVQPTEEVEVPRKMGLTLENDAIRVTISGETGCPVSYFDKKARKELLESAACWQVAKDEDTDTWAHARNFLGIDQGRFICGETEWLEDGCLRKCLRCHLAYEDSTIVIDYLLYHNSRHIEIRVNVNWQQPLSLLRLTVPTVFREGTYLHALPFGWESKPRNGFEQPIGRWSGMMDGESGLYITAPGVFSGLARENIFALTCLRSAYYADHYGIKDDRCHCMDLGEHVFTFMMGSEEAGNLPSEAELHAQKLLQPCLLLPEGFHTGSLPQQMGAVDTDCETVWLTCWKRAEADNGFILRFAEISGKPAASELHCTALNRSWNASFAPFEVKTYFLADNADEIPSEVMMTEFDF